MPVKNIGKRSRSHSSPRSNRNKRKHSIIDDNQQSIAANHSTTKKPLDQFVTIGRFVLETPLSVNDSSNPSLGHLSAIWNYSKHEDSNLEYASLQIVNLDNNLIFEKQVTQLYDQAPTNNIIQGNSNNNNNSSNSSSSNNNDSSSSDDTSSSTHQKLFAHLARLCVNNFIITRSISLNINEAMDMEHYVVTLTLASDTEKLSVRKQLFSCVFPYLYPLTGARGGSFDNPMPMDDFYRHLQPPVSKMLLKKCFVHGLLPLLMPFQSQNVEWMLQKEGFSILDDGSLQENTVNRDQMPYMWEKVAVSRKEHIYINRVTHNIYSSWSPHLEYLRQRMYHGGILADEMGLGKTVSTIALILLHNSRNSEVYRRINTPGLKKTGATLIITPSTISHQWESEFKRHAPDLRVAVYSGIKSMSRFVETEDMVDFLSSNDVVLTSYEILKSEIYYARELPDRSRRLDTQRKAKRSPLIQMFWWRCVVDEAQEVESLKGLATEMAGLIPRYYSWGVTGTPIKSANYDDLYGLFQYLGVIGDLTLTPFQQFYTASMHRQQFLDMTKMTMRRNMKSLLRDQVYIPTQHRHVINVSFSAIERQYYKDLCVLTQEESNTNWLDSIGWRKPQDASSPDFTKFVESTRALRRRLYTLRETCVYPARTGKGSQDVQSLDQVLKLMIQTTLDKIDEAEVGLANCKLTYGGMHELINAEDWKSPLSIYLDWTPHVEEMVKVYSAKLDEAKQLSRSHMVSNLKQDDEFNMKGLETKKTQLLQMTLTTWQNILHRYYFYTAGVYHMLEDNNKENTYYEMAANVRRQILIRPLEKVNASIKEIKNTASELVPKQLPVSFCPQKETLLLTDDFLSRVDDVAETLNQQMNVILEWRDALKKILTSDLVDSTEDEIQGDEYSDSLVLQKKCDMYQDLYQDILRDRHYLVNGVWQAPRITSNNKESTDIIENDADQEELERLREELEKTRQALAPNFHGSDNMRLLVTELREIASRTTAAHKVEIHLIQQELTRLGRVTKQQKDVQELLELEYRKLSALSNHRIEYYRALQQISDHVETWESPNPQQAVVALEVQMNDYTSTIQEQKSRWRYLQNIAKEEQESANGADNNKEMFCRICNEYFTRGIVTQCGHVYCRLCADIWFKTSRRCPQCSATVKVQDRYPIFSALATLQQDTYEPSDAASSSGLSNDTLRQIARVPIEDGLGAKFDSVIRHIKYIQETNNGKCLVFSQWNRLLGILADGLERNDIGHVTLVNRKQDDSIEQFQSDPSINVMLMHSRSHSSGLTLLEAKTVFILEPVLNESLEKQAIGRVHRIGQTEETSVFWYIVRDTIEEKIQAIHNEKQRHRQISNSIELEPIPKPVLVSKSDGGGEFVSDEDLQKCFTKLT